MNLHQFENKKNDQEKIIEAEAFGESEASFAYDEVEKIKRKLETRKKKEKRLRTIFIILAAVIVALLALAGYSQYKVHVLSQEEKNTGIIVTQATTPEDVVRALGKHVLLPEGNPQVAEVKDVEKLRTQQAFFKNAENGDIVVLYETTIFIYRPSKDILVASGDISGLGQAKP